MAVKRGRSYPTKSVSLCFLMLFLAQSSLASTVSRSFRALCLKSKYLSRFQRIRNTFRLFRGGSRSMADNRLESFKYLVIVAVGSNLGNRYENIRRALQLICYDDDSRVVRTSCLHETAPMYVTDQPAFLNGAVELRTNLEPLRLLSRIKKVEADLGRNFSEIRNGPRPVDLDILTYKNATDATNDHRHIEMESAELTIPHARILERDFVLVPLIEIVGPNFAIQNGSKTLKQALDALDTPQGTVRVLPLPRNRLLYWNQTIVMGILNVTPDSFSDGGKWSTSTEAAVKQALLMEKDGAAIIDIGGESTRPGAKEISVGEELERTIPVIQGIRRESNVPISIDTRHAAVAKEAILAGADIVNDVSGGMFDQDMLATVGELGVPMIIMHMRGTPETMQSLTEYKDVVNEVANQLLQQSELAAENHGLFQWMQVLDPGIGFAKDLHGNLELLRNLSVIRRKCHNLPLLIGTSRKGFLGKIAGVEVAAERDSATIASCVTASSLDQEYRSTGIIWRVHNVKQCKQAADVMDALLFATDH